MLCLMPFVHAGAYDEFTDYMELTNLSQEELLKRGKMYLDDGDADSALMYFTLLCNNPYHRYDVEHTAEIYCEAYYQRWFIYCTYIFDYPEAFRNILEAISIRDKAQIYYPKLDMGLSLFYHNIYLQGRSDVYLERKAVDYAMMSFRKALRHGDDDMMDISIVNMLVMESNLNDLSSVKNIWKTYQSANNNTFGFRFNEIYFDVLKFVENKNYEQALAHAFRMLELAEKEGAWRRMSIAYMAVCDLYMRMGEYHKALECINKNEKLGREKNFHDEVLELLKKKSEIYSLIGEKEESDMYRIKYLERKDSLMNFKQMENINKIMFQVKIKDVENEMVRMNILKRIHIRMIVFGSVFLLALVILSVLLYIKMVRLKKSNLTIYENVRQKLKYDSMEHEKVRDEVMKLESEEKEKPRSEQELREKYKTNKLSDLEKKQILDKILTVMNDVDEICSKSFSAKKLAELVGIPYNYVSQVINEYYGCDFNTLLNKFRVNEACRRFSDEENYGNYTIEAVSESLGFKSRTTLINSFKKVVGLTPSEYRKIVKDKSRDAE